MTKMEQRVLATVEAWLALTEPFTKEDMKQAALASGFNELQADLSVTQAFQQECIDGEYLDYRVKIKPEIRARWVSRSYTLSLPEGWGAD